MVLRINRLSVLPWFSRNSQKSPLLLPCLFRNSENCLLFYYLVFPEIIRIAFQYFLVSLALYRNKYFILSPGILKITYQWSPRNRLSLLPYFFKTTQKSLSTFPCFSCNSNHFLVSLEFPRIAFNTSLFFWRFLELPVYTSLFL